MTNEMGMQEEQPGRMEGLKAKAEEIRRDPSGACREYSETAKVKAREFGEKVNNTSLAEMEECAVQYMRDNPGKSLGIAAGLGFVVGLMMSVRKH